MAATVAAVVSGRLAPEFIDRCFDAHAAEGSGGGGGGDGAAALAATSSSVRTPLAPAAAMWLEQVHLAPKAANQWAAGLPSPATCAAPPATDEAGSSMSSAAASEETNSAKTAGDGTAVLAECRALRESVLSTVAASACNAAANGWLEEELKVVQAASVPASAAAAAR